MSDEMIELSLESVSQKLREFFPIDNKADITIIYRDQKFKLQKAYLRLQSKFFSDKLCGKRSILELEGKYSEDAVYNTLHLIYGATLEIQRMDSFHYFQFAKYLGIASIIKQLKKDMIINFEHYEIFELFDLAIKYEEQQIFEKCLNELETHNYIQIKQHTQSLLHTSEQIFKLVIKAYNRFKGDKILSIYEIVDIINNYAENGNKRKDYARSLKFQLIDISKLTSQEYNDLFLLEELNFNQSGSKSDRKCSYDDEFDDQFEEYSQCKCKCNSMEDQFIKKSRTLEMQKTLEQKIKIQLDLEKQKMALQLGELTQTYSKQMRKSSATHQEILQLKTSISQKGDPGAIISNQLASIDHRLAEMSIKMEETTKKLNSLVKESSFFIETYYRKESAEEDRMYMSQLEHKDFVIPDMGKLSCSISDDIRNKLVLKDERLQFDVQPVTIYSQEQLTKLRQIITSYRFSKKKLTLLFKRSRRKGSYGQIRDLCGHKNNLLFLIRTNSNKLVGARIYAKLTEEKGAIQDDKAFLFSVTGSQKFQIDPDCAEEAISMSKGFIICFSTDLMIAENCLQQESYCEWPNSYKGIKGLKQRASDWLVGASQFQITDLECYEIEYLGVDMVL